ncbi:MAG TPA: hypothetical protein DCW55_00025 [Candidatus Pacebacteria bacterium]|nr:hypothetical protein [Candidatus Paceibacterota bacterium]
MVHQRFFLHGKHQKTPRVFSFFTIFFTLILVGCVTVVRDFHLIPEKIRALTESTYLMPTDLEYTAAGYDNDSGAVSALSTEIRIATSSAWWNPNYLKKKTVTMRNNGSGNILSGTTAQILVDTSALVTAGSLQADCDDLRVAFVATTSANARTELARSYKVESSATNCSDSQATIVTFPMQETLWGGGSSANYELYYANPSATAPSGNGYTVGGATATLACAFDGGTTCADGETHGTATGAIRYQNNSALSFDGKNDYVSMSRPTVTNQLTVEAWVYHTQSTGNQAIWGGNTAGYNRLYLSGNTLSGGLNVPTTSCSNKLFAGGTVPVNTWTHVALTYDGSIMRLFVNGTPTASCVASGNVTLDNPINVGLAEAWGVFYGNGMIDELRMSNVARYSGAFTPQTYPYESDNNTLILYHFDENGDDPRNSGKAIDASGNGYHGTIAGAKYVTDSSLPSGAYASHGGVLIEESVTNLVSNPSFEHATFSTNWTPSHFTYATASATFTGAMAKRNSAGPFAAGVMSQGIYSNATSPDIISASSGTQISGVFYSNYDPSQGSIVFWITPEWNGNDGKKHAIVKQYQAAIGAVYKETDNYLYYNLGWNVFVKVDVSSWTAGSTYNVVIRWDRDVKLDGTNYLSMTVNDSATFMTTSMGGSVYNGNSLVIGSDEVNSADALIEGLTIYRRPLFDGTYGIDVGNGDEINQIYSAGTGKDPTLVTGSWDVVFALPTSATAGTLSTGTGNAWSMPHSSNLLYTNTTNTGGFMLNGTYTSDGFADIGTVTVSALSTASKIFAGGYAVNSPQWGGIYRDITVTAGQDVVIRGIAHSDGTSQPQLILYDQTNGAEIGSLYGTTSSTRADPDVLLFTGEAPANCTTVRVKLVNASATASTVNWHQVEVYANLMNNPSMEGVDADPFIPAGWTNGGVSTGAGIRDTTSYNSGSNSFKLNRTIASSYVGIYQSIASATQGIYYSVGYWTNYESGQAYIGSGSNSGYIKQATYNTTNMHSISSTSQDGYLKSVARFDLTPPDRHHRQQIVYSEYDRTAVYSTDDYYLFPLTAVSLTVPPASQAGSTEASGLRVDGGDALSQPLTGWSTGGGVVKFKMTPRHSTADSGKFGYSNGISHLFIGDGTNFVWLYSNGSANYLYTRANGVDKQTALSGSFVAGTTYTIEIAYASLVATVKVNGTVVATTQSPGAFSVAPTAVRFGNYMDGTAQSDMTVTSFVTASATENTSAPYYKSGSKSAKLIGYDAPDQYVIPTTTTANGAHTISAYVFSGTSSNLAGTVDATVATIASDSASLTPSYTDMGGGWWRLTYATPTIPAGTYRWGVEVKPGKTIYVDGVQTEQRGYVTSYADGSLGTGYAWTGTANSSTSTRTVPLLTYANSNISKTQGSISAWVKLNEPCSVHGNGGKFTILRVNGSDPTWTNLNFHLYYETAHGCYGRMDARSTYSSTLLNSAAFTEGKWAHVVGTWSATDNAIRVYVNGSNSGAS